MGREGTEPAEGPLRSVEATVTVRTVGRGVGVAVGRTVGRAVGRGVGRVGVAERKCTFSAHPCRPLSVWTNAHRGVRGSVARR